MEFNRQFIDELRVELSKPLPGETAQYRMAPSYRPRLTPQQIAALNPRISGVMLLLYERAGLLNIAFTQRKTYEGVHSGQMSFPGGKKDEEDNDLVQTALRETEEEIGLDRNRIEIIGRLSELYIPPSNFLVYPSVGFVEQVTEFVPQPTEVEKVVEVPVDFFLDQQNINMQTEIKVMGGTIVRVPAYHFNGHVIWGATAIMLSEFTFILENILNPKP
ncbi:MAG TPA: CoA pyrophosphatase [Chitinophagales bacterium]|nr:CoA pyrophosphatase [Chitinophagales bacterium]